MLSPSDFHAGFFLSSSNAARDRTAWLAVNTYNTHHIYHIYHTYHTYHIYQSDHAYPSD